MKVSLNSFWIGIVLFFLYSFGINTTNTFIHHGSSLENHTGFQTKLGKVYTHFQTERAQNPYPLGRHIPKLYSLYKEVCSPCWGSTPYKEAAYLGILEG